ncbi:MAG: tRNA threonylcarbamoyladenosine dehydratase [Eubacteriales bacterium]|nr:tRNA threonylcarbamoyladenosine dehydratase [Eubacteriales bacterium]MDD3198309.1 tRNA threonylcarbamoyladenosine dehydratase [Eubacteriales bacterium]MDD3504540.1 tRNA threonylcarbamoyladenosine dehydratase [Eubacteriales bacterium]MDD4682631.1 tRNA threonylcarbamoyladenosine dehydratase [Eubacteriales bacterium]
MENQFCRTEMLIGASGLKKLHEASVAVFGLGGVGSYTVEALARAGVGRMILIDHDTVALSNLNRQLIATHDTIGRAKVEVARERILAINPSAQVEVYQEMFLPGSRSGIINPELSYVVDAVDNVTAKIELVIQTQAINIPLISAMGTGNKLDPTQFEVADIYATSVCPLCRVMRRELKRRDVKQLKVVYSREEPQRKPGQEYPASISFVPPVAGLILAGEVIKSLIND